jgi:hypothetical protein
MSKTIGVKMALEKINNQCKMKEQRGKNIWHYVCSNESSDTIGKMTLGGHSQRGYDMENNPGVI